MPQRGQLGGKRPTHQPPRTRDRHGEGMVRKLLKPLHGRHVMNELLLPVSEHGYERRLGEARMHLIRDFCRRHSIDLNRHETVAMPPGG